MQLSLANPLTLYVQSMKDTSFVALFPQVQRNGNKPAKGTQEHGVYQPDEAWHTGMLSETPHLKIEPRTKMREGRAHQLWARTARDNVSRTTGERGRRKLHKAKESLHYGIQRL